MSNVVDTSSDLGQPFPLQDKKVGVWIVMRRGFLATIFALKKNYSNCTL